MLEFSILDYDAAPWDQIESCVDHLVYKSRPWMDFVRATQRLQPLLIAVAEDGRTIGFFLGATFRKGIKIVASPFEGWNTGFQGLSMLEAVPAAKRVEIYAKLIKFCYSTPGCSLFQATDWSLKTTDLDGTDYTVRPVRGYTMDLTLDEKTLHARFDRASRRAIEKAKEYGLTVREPEDLERFVHDYYDQLLEVFKKRSQAPTFPRSRVLALVKHLHGTGSLLILETRSAEQKCIATAIFIHAGGIGHWWGSASYKADQILRPNEILFWEGVKRLKAQGVVTLELGSTGTYKEKYGPAPYACAQIIVPRWKILTTLKAAAQKVYYWKRYLPWKHEGPAEA